METSVKRKHHTQVRRVASSRWRAAKHYGESQKIDPLRTTPVRRMKNKTIHKRKQEFYSKGPGANGIKIHPRRVETALRKLMGECLLSLSELVQITGAKNALGEDTPGRWLISRSFVRPVQAATDAYVLEILKQTHKIACQRRPDTRLGHSGDAKHGIKLTKSDLLTAIELYKHNRRRE